MVTSTSDGQRRICSKKELARIFRGDILEGRLNAESSVEVYTKNDKGQWDKNTRPLSQFATGYFKLRVLYEPVWAHAMAGLGWGAMIGIALKFLDSLIGLGLVNPALALAFLGWTVFFIAFSKNLLVGAAVLYVLYRVCRDLKVDLFTPGISLSVAIVTITGLILGGPPGMAIGGAIGLLRKPYLTLAPDAKPERKLLAWKVFILPLLASIGLWWFYLGVFCPWAIHFLSAQ